MLFPAAICLQSAKKARARKTSSVFYTKMYSILFDIHQMSSVAFIFINIYFALILPQQMRGDGSDAYEKMDCECAFAREYLGDGVAR